MVCRCHKIVAGQTLVVTVGRSKLQPVAVVPAAKPQVFLGGNGHYVIYPLLHCREHFLKDFPVAIGKIQLPRTNGNGVSPTAASLNAPNVRNNLADGALFALTEAHIAQPFTEELFNVVVVRSGLDKHLRITRPALTLVTLGTVGGYIEEVAALTPKDVLEETVEHRVGGFNIACSLHIAIHGDSSKVIERRLAREFVNANIAEAVKGKCRLKGLLAVTTGVIVSALGRTVVFVIKIAVLIENFGKRKTNPFPCFGNNFQFDVAG